MSESPNLVPAHRPVAIGLLLLAFTILLMVGLGGYVRLSGSGLSIPHWPFIDHSHNLLPPSTEEGWVALKKEYNSTLETIENAPVGPAQSVAEFKRLFYVEYSHRALATVVGFAYLFVFCATLFSRDTRKAIFGRILVIGLLILAQAILGGIVVQQHLKAYKVALHLTLAFYLFGLVLWMYLTVKRRVDEAPSKNRMRLLAYHAAGAVLLQVFLGGLMAGSLAGYQLNTWPKMGESWIATPLWDSSLGIANFNSNIVLIQFLHRYWAYFAVAAVVWAAVRMRQFQVSALGRTVMNLAVLVVVIQFAIGVLTLVMKVHLHTALTHQLIGLVLFGLLAVACHEFKYRPVVALSGATATSSDSVKGGAASHA
jgi:cytochrome c oxidase assembly protein subunit 15